MKAIKYLYICILILLFSCEGVLDRAPLDKISDLQVWNNESMVKSIVTNLYSRLPVSFDNIFYCTYSDEQTTPFNSNGITMGTVSKTSEMLAYWDYSYIRDCNVFLEQIKTAVISNQQKKQFEGEVRFIRAYIYFEMMERYGGVPLVDIVIDPYLSIDNKYVVRAKEEEIADFIDSECTLAAGLLSDVSTPLGTVNKWTALALQARSDLWAASIAKFSKVELNGVVGITASKANSYYQKAAAAADAVIKSNKYTLYNANPANKTENYRKIFLVENNTERIFVKAYDGTNIGHRSVIPPQFAGVTGGGSQNPTLEFILRYENVDGSSNQPELGAGKLYNIGYEPFANKDPRLLASVFFQGDKWGNGTVKSYEGIDPSPTPNPTTIIRSAVDSYNGVPCAGIDSRSLVDKAQATASGFHNKKYLDELAIGTPAGLNKEDLIIFRLAEMYLIKAEAEFELGNNKNAVEALNMTRNRAGISLVNEASITREKIRNERASEMYAEQNRYWDLRRWRIAQAVLNYRFQGLQIILHYATGKFYFIPMYCESFTRIFRQEHYYNPITTSRIDNNPKLIENPGY